MNPLTNVKNINKLNEIEAELGVAGSKTSWHEQYKDSAYIFVGGLPYDLTEGDIICVFSQYGEIVNINLVRDKKTGKSKGYCFIAYENQRSTILAVDNFNGIKLLGRVLRVDHVGEYRKPKEDEDDDEVTKQLRQDGCAPKTPSPSASSDEEEEDYPTPKKKSKKEHKTKSKDKKKKKKKKHKKDIKMSSKSHPDSSDSDESSPSEEHQSPVTVRIKQEVDRGYRDSEMDNPKRTGIDDRDTMDRHMKRDYDDHPQKDERRWRHDDTKQTEQRGDSASRLGRESHKDRGRVVSPSPNRQRHHRQESFRGDRDRDSKEERGKYEFVGEEKHPDVRDGRRPDRREETGEERFKGRDKTGERRHESRRTDQEPAGGETYPDRQRGGDKDRSREMDAPKNRYGESHRDQDRPSKRKDQDSYHERGSDRSEHKMEKPDSKDKDYKKRYR